MIRITRNAVNHIKDFLGKEDLGKRSIRIWVQNGGCAGQTYRFGIDDKRKRDKAFTVKGIPFLVDKESLGKINGLELDYQKGFWGGSFSFHNPKARTVCGCGMSFST